MNHHFLYPANNIFDFLPFGEEMAAQHSQTADFETRYKFNDYGGKKIKYLFVERIQRSCELDQETGLYYYGARYYNPQTNIWLSVDPLVEKYPGINPYVYTMANPINLVDPDGKSTLPPDDYFINNNGTIEVIRTDDNFDRFFIQHNEGYLHVANFNKNEHGLIQLPQSFKIIYDYTSKNGPKSFGFTSHTLDRKRFLSGEAVAVLFGALNKAQVTDLSLGQFSLFDGSSPPPSVSHVNGKNGDLRLLRTDRSGGAVTVFSAQYDMQRTSLLTIALNKFGYKDILSEKNSFGQLASYTRHFSGYKNKTTGKWVSVRHHHHLHLQGFQPNIIEIKGPCYGKFQKY